MLYENTVYRLTLYSFNSLMFEIVSFGAKLERLGKEGLEMADPLLKDLGYAAVLANDYFSWEKELKEHQNDKGIANIQLMNAVAVVIENEHVDVPKAKERVKTASIKYEQEYMKARGRLEADRRTLSGVIAFLNAQAEMVGGTNLWHAESKRYQVNHISNGTVGTLDVPEEDHLSKKRKLSTSRYMTTDGPETVDHGMPKANGSRKALTEVVPSVEIQVSRTERDDYVGHNI